MEKELRLIKFIIEQNVGTMYICCSSSCRSFLDDFLLLSLRCACIIAEVITSAEFHPTHCNMLAYSSSKGCIRLIDLRQSALCDSHAKM